MKLNGSQPGEINYTPPYSTGLFLPPHAKRFGVTVSLFMAFENKVTDGKGTDGFVLGGAAVRDEDFSEVFKTHAKSVAVTRRKLERWGYIQTKKVKGGAYTVVVKKSKKWELLKRLRKNESVPAEYESVPNQNEYALAEGLLPIYDKVEISKRLYRELHSWWNENCNPFPAIKVFTEDRQDKLKARLKKNPRFLDDLKTAVARLKQSDFACQEWRPAIDWFLRKDSHVIRALEGQYDNKGGKYGTPSTAGNTGRRGSERASRTAGTLRESTHYTPTPSVL